MGAARHTTTQDACENGAGAYPRCFIKEARASAEAVAGDGSCKVLAPNQGTRNAADVKAARKHPQAETDYRKLDAFKAERPNSRATARQPLFSPLELHVLPKLGTSAGGRIVTKRYPRHLAPSWHTKAADRRQ